MKGTRLESLLPSREGLSRRMWRAVFKDHQFAVVRLLSLPLNLSSSSHRWGRRPSLLPLMTSLDEKRRERWSVKGAASLPLDVTTINIQSTCWDPCQGSWEYKDHSVQKSHSYRPNISILALFDSRDHGHYPDCRLRLGLDNKSNLELKTMTFCSCWVMNCTLECNQQADTTREPSQTFDMISCTRDFPRRFFLSLKNNCF